MATRTLGRGRVTTTSKTARYTGGIGKSRVVSSSSSRRGGGSAGSYIATGVPGKVGYASSSVEAVYQGKKEEGKIIYHRYAGGGGLRVAPPPKVEPRVAIDVSKVKQFNILMESRGVRGREYLSALKGNQEAILKATGHAQAEKGFQEVREAEKTSYERAVERQQAREQRMYLQRERVKGQSQARGGTLKAVSMMPYDFTVGFGSQVISAGEKGYLMARGLFEKDIKKKDVGKEVLRAGGKVPGVLKETFDYRTAEGRVAIGTVLLFTLIGGSALKSARARGRAFTGGKHHHLIKGKKVSHFKKGVRKGKITFRKVSDYLEVTKKGKVYPIEKGFKVPRKTVVEWKGTKKFKIGHKKVKVGQVKYFGKRGRMQMLEKLGLRKPKVHKLIKAKARPGKVRNRISRLESRGSLHRPKKPGKRFRQDIKQRLVDSKKVYTSQNTMRQRALAQAKKPPRPFGSKSYRKAVRTQLRVKEGLRPGYDAGKQLHHYKVAKTQAKVVKKGSFFKRFLRDKRGQQQLLKLKQVHKQPKLSAKLKTFVTTKPVLVHKTGLFIPPTSILGGGVIKPRAKAVIIPRVKTGIIPALKRDYKAVAIPKVKVIQEPILDVAQKPQQITIPRMNVALALGSVGLGAFAFKDFLKPPPPRIKPEWPGGGGGGYGKTFGWRYGLKLHRMNTKKLLGV